MGGLMIRKLGFTGTQIGMTGSQQATVSTLLGQAVQRGIKELHHGDCVGADAEVHRIAELWDLKVVVHPPLLDAKRAFCKSDEIREPTDYITRNYNIVDSTDVLLAAPRTMREEIRSGTWTTVRYAKNKHRRVLIIFPDGTVRREE